LGQQDLSHLDYLVGLVLQSYQSDPLGQLLLEDQSDRQDLEQWKLDRLGLEDQSDPLDPSHQEDQGQLKLVLVGLEDQSDPLDP
jgi:hypothetical protein